MQSQLKGSASNLSGKSVQPECKNDDRSLSDMSVKSQLNDGDVSSLSGDLSPERADTESQSNSGEEVDADKVVTHLARKGCLQPGLCYLQTEKESAHPKSNVQMEKDDKYPVDMYFSKDNNPAKMKLHVSDSSYNASVVGYMYFHLIVHTKKGMQLQRLTKHMGTEHSQS